jgi:hypothetical protein
LTDSVGGAKVVGLNRSSTSDKENVVSATTTPRSTSTSAPIPDLPIDPCHELHGWQALAAASLGRLLSDAELAAAQHLPVAIALDLLFPDLDDAARHEALSTLA